ncbi:MAG: hypothetical protein SFU83_13905 [Meiothermus sp.]|nr:hypothetical protein [Meiothermus sp.]
MGHSVRIVVGSRGALEWLATRWVKARVCDLRLGYAGMPLTDELADDINDLLQKPTRIVPFELLSESHHEVLEQSSQHAPLAYLETKYFGGTGSQCAVMFEGGRVTLGPLKTYTPWDEKLLKYGQVPSREGAINAVLRAMGVWRRPGSDEFETLELGRYRSNDALLRQAQRRDGPKNH